MLYLSVCGGWKNFTTLVVATTHEKRLLFYSILFYLVSIAGRADKDLLLLRPLQTKLVPKLTCKSCIWGENVRASPWRANQLQIGAPSLFIFLPIFIFSSSLVANWNRAAPISAHYELLNYAYLSSSLYSFPHIMCISRHTHESQVRALWENIKNTRESMKWLVVVFVVAEWIKDFESNFRKLLRQGDDTLSRVFFTTTTLSRFLKRNISTLLLPPLDHHHRDGFSNCITKSCNSNGKFPARVQQQQQRK